MIKNRAEAEEAFKQMLDCIEEITGDKQVWIGDYEIQCDDDDAFGELIMRKHGYKTQTQYATRDEVSIHIWNDNTNEVHDYKHVTLYPEERERYEGIAFEDLKKIYQSWT